MKPITINYRDHKITLSSAFKKRAFTVGTIEYEQLQAVRRDFVGFELEIRQFKKNTKQEHYKGLNYDFMRWYIQKVEGDNAPEVSIRKLALACGCDYVRVINPFNLDQVIKTYKEAIEVLGCRKRKSNRIIPRIVACPI